MEQAAVAPKLRGKPGKIWFVITFVAGAAGALSAVAAAGVGTYDVEPFRIELRAAPASGGTTELAVRAVPRIQLGHAEAPTHSAPLRVRVTVLGATETLLPGDPARIKSPKDLVAFMGADAKDAVRSFAIKCALLAASGGAAAGAALSLFGMRWRRVVGAALAGVLTFGLIGAMMQQTYDSSKFLRVRYVPEQQQVLPGDLGPGGLELPQP